MKRIRRKLAMITGLLGIASVVVCGSLHLRPASVPGEYILADHSVRISPDYRDCVAPPNIAPLNFVIQEEGSRFCVRIHAPKGDEIVVSSRSGKIVIPIKRWRDLLDLNRGSDVSFDIYARDGQGLWQRFETIRNHVAHEPADPYIVYRLLAGPNHSFRPDMGIQERHIESFDERWLVPYGKDRCVNCHTFTNNDPQSMILHLRGDKDEGNAMILARDGQVTKINTVTPFNPAPAAFTAWHPSGKVAAFSMNKPRLLHLTAGESRTTIDLTSDLGLYVIETNTVLSTRAISRPDRRETYPAWSPDGRYLYFVSGKKPWSAKTEGPETIATFRQIKYDLMRIGYDIETHRWGEVETVLSGDEFGLSINEPRISPDGRFLLFIAAEYGGFPVYLDSDLYILKLDSGKYWPLAKANSDQCDSWHSWSTNGRWVVFGSKARDHLLTKVYFTYIDANGQASKPVLLPQRDPTHYDSLLMTYNAPEFVTGPVQFDQEQLLESIRSSPAGQQADAISRATVNVGAGH